MVNKQLALTLEDQRSPSLSEQSLQDFIISGRTAIGRTKVSAPLQILLDGGYLTGPGTLLHYGKGRTTLDSPAMEEVGLTVFDYDYVHCPAPELLGSSYSLVFCCYVVNTLPKGSRAHVYRQLAYACGGTVFIAARSDRIKGTPEPDNDGVRTSKGTFQKSYQSGELKAEAGQYFDIVENIKAKQGISIVACRRPKKLGILTLV